MSDKQKPHAGRTRPRPFYAIPWTVKGAIQGTGQRSHELDMLHSTAATLHHMHNYTVGADTLTSAEEVQDPVIGSCRLIGYRLEIYNGSIGDDPRATYSMCAESVLGDEVREWETFGYNDPDDDLLHFGNLTDKSNLGGNARLDQPFVVIVTPELHKRLLGKHWVNHCLDGAIVRYRIDVELGVYFKYDDEA